MFQFSIPPLSRINLYNLLQTRQDFTWSDIFIQENTFSFWSDCFAIFCFWAFFAEFYHGYARQLTNCWPAPFQTSSWKPSRAPVWARLRWCCHFEAEEERRIGRNCRVALAEGPVGPAGIQSRHARLNGCGIGAGDLRDVHDTGEALRCQGTITARRTNSSGVVIGSGAR